MFLTFTDNIEVEVQISVDAHDDFENHSEEGNEANEDDDDFGEKGSESADETNAASVLPESFFKYIR